MKKLRLELDALAVESFATDAGAERMGTVRGHYNTELDCTLDRESCKVSCDPCYTCATSCAGGPICDCMRTGCPNATVCCANV